MTRPAIPTVEDIQRVAGQLATEPPAGSQAVNQNITDLYHALSENVRAELEAGNNLDWCGFAKWSSHTVGTDLVPGQPGIRIQTLLDRIDRALDTPLQILADALGALGPTITEQLRPRIRDLLLVALIDLRDHDLVAHDALRIGNAVIFHEMGTLFVRLLERLTGPQPPPTSPEDFAAQVALEVEGLTLPGLDAAINHDHLLLPDRRHLERGIGFYLRAERKQAHRPELMLAGSMCFSIYEQTRADRLITIGMCGPVRSAILIPQLELLGLPPRQQILLSSLDEQHPFFKPIDKLAGEILTLNAVQVRIAGQLVLLGKPEELVPKVTSTLQEVTDLLAPLTVDGRPRNWTDLGYRLGVIRRYFAAFQGLQAAQAKRTHPPTPA